MNFRKLRKYGLGLVLGTVFSSPVFAQSNVLFILDGSNSMWGQVDGVAKIETARQVLGSLVKELPPDTRIALMAYGHRSEGDCKDVQQLVAMDANNRGSVVEQITGIQPKGKTPLSYSIEQAGLLLEPLKGQQNSVVLVSDGKETCGGDPCAVAKQLAATGIDVKVHVVGFDVSAEERAQLECIAREGNGRYFDARNTAGFEEAVAAVGKEVAEAPAAPPEPAVTEVFRDDFDGEELSDNWSVLNPNPDNYIVEEGGLLMLSQSPGDIGQENIQNMIRLVGPLPKGDWSMTAKFNIDLQTAQERVIFGMYQDKDNYIVALLAPPGGRDGWDKWGALKLHAVKNTKGQVTQFSRDVFELRRNKKYLSLSEAADNVQQPLVLRLRKQGRSYYVGVMFAGAEEPAWIELEKLTSLRAKGDLVFGLYQNKGVSGESTVLLDEVRIEVEKPAQQ